MDIPGPGVQVVALVPVAGPVPPPIKVVMPAESASHTSCGQMKWTCASMPPAVTIRSSPAITSVPATDDHAGRHTVHDVGIAGLADRDDTPAADANVGLDDSPVVEDYGVGDDEVERALGRSTQWRIGPYRRAELCRRRIWLLRRQRQISFDFDEQIGVGQADAVARGRAIKFRILAAGIRSVMVSLRREAALAASFEARSRASSVVVPSVSPLSP